MKITIKKSDITIIVDETDNSDKDRKASLKYNEQMCNIHKTIILMVEQINNLIKN